MLSEQAPRAYLDYLDGLGISWIACGEERIDARGGMASTFDGLPMDREPFQLELKSVQSYGDGAVWIRYNVK